MSDNFLVKWDVNFTRLPNWLLEFRDSDGKALSPQAIKTFFALASFADNNTMEAYPSQALLAEKADMSIKSIQRYLKELKDLEIIRVSKNSNGKDKWVNNVYHLNVNPPKSFNPPVEVEEVEEEAIEGEIVDPYLVDLGMTEGDRPRKRTLNDEIFDGFAEFLGSVPSDEKVLGDWYSNIPRLIKLYKNDNIDALQFKAATMAACAAYVTRFTDGIPLNPRTLANNWENIKPKKYNKQMIDKAVAVNKYAEDLPEGVKLEGGRIVIDE